MGREAEVLKALKGSFEKLWVVVASAWAWWKRRNTVMPASTHVHTHTHSLFLCPKHKHLDPLSGFMLVFIISSPSSHNWAQYTFSWAWSSTARRDEYIINHDFLHKYSPCYTVERDMAGVLPLQQTIAIISFSPFLPISLKNFHKAYLIANPKDRRRWSELSYILES